MMMMMRSMIIGRRAAGSSLVSKQIRSMTSSLPPPVEKKSSSSSWVKSIVKFGVFSLVTGALATAGYATYAYTLEELDEKTQWLRHPIQIDQTPAHSPALQKFQAKLYSNVLTASARTINFYLDVRKLLEEKAKELAEPSSDRLLPPCDAYSVYPPTLVLDLHETLTYTDWKRERGWRTFKRPGLDDFLAHLSQYYEIVVYTDKQTYELDPYAQRFGSYISSTHILGRPATKYQNGKYYRDLSKLGRDPSRTLYISAYALENSLQPENGIPIKPWNLEAEDTALLDLLPFLQYLAVHPECDVRTTLASYKDCDIPSEFTRRIESVKQRRTQGTISEVRNFLKSKLSWF